MIKYLKILKSDLLLVPLNHLTVKFLIKTEDIENTQISKV